MLASLLEDLAPNIPQGLIGKAIAVASAIRPSETCRAAALTALSKQLPQTERAELLHKLLIDARAMQKDRDSGDVLATGQRDRDCGSVLATVAPHLIEKELLKEALQAARSLEDKSAKVGVFAVLAPRLAPEERSEVFSEAVAAARDIDIDENRVPRLVYLAEQVPEQLLGEILAAVELICEETRQGSRHRCSCAAPGQEHAQKGSSVSENDWGRRAMR
jgi:hypothetical protein